MTSLQRFIFFIFVFCLCEIYVGCSMTTPVDGDIKLCYRRDVIDFVCSMFQYIVVM